MMKMNSILRKACAVALSAVLALSCVACANGSVPTENPDVTGEYVSQDNLTQQIPGTSGASNHTQSIVAASVKASSSDGTGEAAQPGSSGVQNYTAADLTPDMAVSIMYDVNNLQTVMGNHNSVTAEIICRDANNTVSYSKVVQMKKQSDGNYYVRIHLESGIGSGEMEGSSEAGYVACKWNDGSIEVACSAPDEFFSLVQEAYLEPYANVKFSNVTVTDQNGDIAVTADVTYDDSQDIYKTTYILDGSDLHIRSISEDYYQSQGGTLTTTTMYYDQSYEFSACSVLNEVQNAPDAVPFHVVYTAPEYGYTKIADYTMSASVHPIVDSEGYVNVFSSPDLAKDSQLQQINLNGETTVYAVITSFNLMEAQQDAVESFENSTSVMYATGHGSETAKPAASAAPSATPAPAVATPDASKSVYVVQNPEDQIVNVGGTASFVAYADFDQSITWSFISPDGSTTVIDSDASNYFGGLRVSGIGTDTLTLTYIPKVLNGWKLQCAFGGINGPAYTDMATLTVIGADSSYSGSSSGSSGHSSQPVSVDNLSTLARNLADNSVYDVIDRISGWDWYTGSVSNYSYNSDKQVATYDIDCSYGGLDATFHFRAYPNLSYAVPVGYDAWMTYPGGNYDVVDSRTFPSNSDQTTCWAAFGDGIVDLTSAVTGTTSHSDPYYDYSYDYSENYSYDYSENYSYDYSEDYSYDYSEDYSYDYSEDYSSDASSYTPSGSSAAYGDYAGSGSIYSTESSSLVLNTEWSAVVQSESSVLVTVNVSLTCATITTIERPVTINLNGQVASFYAPGFTYEDNTWHYTQLGSYSFSVPVDYSCSLPLTVSWSYNGTYSGVSIGDLTCSGYIDIVR